MQLVLASSSRYRQTLLGRLKLPFAVRVPGIDETPRPGESPADLAARLAREKALAVATAEPSALVIGSDQVASVAGATMGKPGNAARAREQLARCSGRSVLFHTAVCVARGTAEVDAALDTTTVTFRELSPAEIDRYLALEQPWDCAGSFKCEGLGSVLFESIATRDPSALVGLPLISLARLLRKHGLDPLANAAEGPSGQQPQ